MLTEGYRSPAWRLLGVAVVALLLTAAVPPTNAAPAPLPPLGMDVESARALQAAGAAPRYGSFWVGAWIAQHGWGGMDQALRTAKETGTTPVLYFWYWGDGITKSCVEHGCNGKSREQWYAFADTMGEHVRTIMEGREVLIVLENEFNKNDIVGPYAPTFDAHLETIAKDLKTVPGVKIVLGFGAWNEAAWTQFPKAAAQSEYIGFQMMRGSTRHDEAQYREAASEVARFTTHIASTFNKPSFLYDLALSSYQGATWERVQAETLQGVFDNLVTAGQTGLQGVIYRSMNDHYMDPSNYFGAAESHWGLRYGDGRPKPAWDVWLKAATATTPTPPTVNVPGAFEAESATATAGGRQALSSASGGAVWNLWSNGELRFPLHSEDAIATRITVVARGDLAGGVAPRMEVWLGGALLGARDVGASSFAPFAFDAAVPAGDSTLRVVFTNDVRTTSEDRNLVLDVVQVVVPTNAPPVAAFEASGSHLTWAFDARGSGDPDGDTLTYAWTFGDGTTATGATASRTYAADGSYIVKLTVSDGRLSSQAERTVVATRPNQAPSAAFAVTGKELVWSFDASASHDADGDALTYVWSFGDGSSAAGVRVTKEFPRSGDWRVTLTVRDPAGAESASTQTVKATSPPFTALFGGIKGNGWWVQVDVTASRSLTGVCASVDGGFCQPLRLQSWGSWAASFRVPQGSQVVFRATATTGETVTSGAYHWPSGAPVLKASFAPHDGNEWWVQARVDASAPLSSVCASVNGGACQPLQLRSWGSWAASFRAPAGSKVVFAATATDGQVARSGAYSWPVA